MNLEEKSWYRLVKVLYILCFLFLILISICSIFAYYHNWYESILYAGITILVITILAEILKRSFMYIVVKKPFFSRPVAKHFLLLVGLTVLLIVFYFAYLFLYEKPTELRKEKERIEEQKKEIVDSYQGAISKIDSLRQQYFKCIEPAIENEYKKQKRDCDLKRGNIKQDYDYCMSGVEYGWESQASCLYAHDYEKIDCTEEKLRLNARLDVVFKDLAFECASYSNELNKLDNVIKAYEEMQKADQI